MIAFDTARANTPFTEVSPGQIFFIDGVKIEILGGKNPTLIAGNDIINNSSVVMRISGGARSVLFTGDLGPEGADVILGTAYAPKLKSDYLQMAHHGNGANAANFSQPEVELIRDEECSLNESYIDVVSMDIYGIDFENSDLSELYQFVYEHRPTLYQQLALVPGTFTKVGQESTEIQNQALRLQGYCISSTQRA